MLLRRKETLQLNCDWFGAGFLWPQSLEKWACAGEQMWVAGFPQGLLLHSGHTSMQRRLNPGFGPVAWGRSLSSSPQKPLSLAAMPYSSTPSSFSHPSLLFQIIFYNSPFLQTPFFIFYPKSFSSLLLIPASSPPPTSHLHPSLSYPPQGCPFVSLQPSSYLSVEVRSPVAAALECQTVIY